MKDDVSQLKSLGSKSTEYTFEVNSSLLECFPNKAEGRDSIVRLITREFTSLCPKTGQPDFAEIDIKYIPNKLCVESKSLKLYLFSYRNTGSFMETIVNQIADDLFALMQPKQLTVVGEFAPRGGIAIIVEANRRQELVG